MAPALPEITDLRSRIARKRAAGRSTFREVERLRLLVLAELEAAVSAAKAARAADRREPGSRQREFALDE